jgi:hypothetical protein
MTEAPQALVAEYAAERLLARVVVEGLRRSTVILLSQELSLGPGVKFVHRLEQLRR